MKVTLILCDHAQVADGKLNLLGGGWVFTGPEPAPMALAILIEVPWNSTNVRLPFTVELRDEDGALVSQSGPLGAQPLRIQAEIEVGRPAGHPRATPITMPLALNFPGLPLAPGRRYVWAASLAGEHREEWSVGFNVRPDRHLKD